MEERDVSIIGQAPEFLAVLEKVSQVADLDRPVLVVGERGTGKDLIARRLHYLSHRWQEPLLTVNCAALAESLLDSELFGHEAGAFTGATRLRTGRFERAGQGTLFLDEVGAMSPRLQDKLLRVIEYGEFERLGGAMPLRSRARVVGATNEDLPTLVDQGRFRADLLDRLAFVVITLPPLRARPEDIPLLADHFGLAMTRELKREYFPGFSRQAARDLLDHHWPGNVRELKSVVERAVCITEPGQVVEKVVLDPFASPFRPGRQPVRTGGEAERESSIPPGPLPTDFKAWIREREQEILARALEMNRYNRKKTARRLGLTYDQLRGYLRKYDLIPR